MCCGPQVPPQAVWLTHPRIPIKLERSNRGCPDHREGAAIRFCSSRLGGRPIGRTPDSGSKASSPPAIFFNDLRCAELPKVAYFLFSLVKKSVKNCTKIGQSFGVVSGAAFVFVHIDGAGRIPPLAGICVFRSNSS